MFTLNKVRELLLKYNFTITVSGTGGGFENRSANIFEYTIVGKARGSDQSIYLHKFNSKNEILATLWND